MTNKLVLSGKILKTPYRTKSPAGIPHCYFTLEHNSIAKEADFSRKVFCRISVVASGLKSEKATQNLQVGMDVEVSGFVAYQVAKNGLQKIILHAEKIKIL